MRSSRSWRVARAMLAVGALALVATGCSRVAGAAAVVDGNRIEMSAVEQVADEINQINVAGGGEPTVTAAYLNVMITGPVFVEEAEKADFFTTAEVSGVPTNVEEYREQLDQLFTQQGIDPSSIELSDKSLNLLYQSGVQSLVNEYDPDLAQEIEAKIAASDIRINPRFGNYENASAQGLPWQSSVMAADIGQ